MVSSDTSAASANICPDTFNNRQWFRRVDVGMAWRDVHTFKQGQFNVSNFYKCVPPIKKLKYFIFLEAVARTS